eukprot:GILK01012985.1.p1 GENE.GILK01012985.1~~GILK01012985.1.p1  ORF type:complete len:153 (-),score=20.51 GILK01012985.1:118-531(-)
MAKGTSSPTRSTKKVPRKRTMTRVAAAAAAKAKSPVRRPASPAKKVAKRPASPAKKVASPKRPASPAKKVKSPVAKKVTAKLVSPKDGSGKPRSPAKHIKLRFAANAATRNSKYPYTCDRDTVSTKKVARKRVNPRV